MTRQDFCQFISWLEEYDGSADLEPYHDLLEYLERRFAASPLPAEPPPDPAKYKREDSLGTFVDTEALGVAYLNWWIANHRTAATPSAAEPQRMANINCWNWLHDIDLTLNTCLAVTVNPQAFDLPQVRANIDASRRAIESLKALLNDALRAAEPQREE